MKVEKLQPSACQNIFKVRFKLSKKLCLWVSLIGIKMNGRQISILPIGACLLLKCTEFLISPKKWSRELIYTRKMQLFTHRNKKERNIRAKVPFEDFCTVEILYNRYGICSNKRNTKPFEDGTWGAEQVTKKTSVSINICIKYSGAIWETAECVIHRRTHIQPHALTSSYVLYKKT